MLRMLVYVCLGTLMGITFVLAEIISWYRMQEMFRFQSFHMYGIIGTAVVVSFLGIQLLKKFGNKSLNHQEITPKIKTWSWGLPIGGFIFGIGWAMTGACPGPIFIQLGTGSLAAILMFLSAVLGTFVYGKIRKRLPH
jgi:uncharacterized membrane protein YedE/YeeE